MVEGMAHAATGIAVLQTPGEDCVQGNAGDDAELPGSGDGPSQAPVRDAGAHAALNDRRKIAHPAPIVS